MFYLAAYPLLLESGEHLMTSKHMRLMAKYWISWRLHSVSLIICNNSQENSIIQILHNLQHVLYFVFWGEISAALLITMSWIKIQANISLFKNCSPQLQTGYAPGCMIDGAFQYATKDFKFLENIELQILEFLLVLTNK